MVDMCELILFAQLSQRGWIFPREVELELEWTGLPGMKVKAV